MSISIKEARVDDLEALVKLLDVLFNIEQDFSPNKTFQRNGLQLLHDSPKRGQIFVADHPMLGAVGMVSVQMVISTAMGGYSAWVEDMVVIEQCRGQGVGKALLERAIDWAKAKGAKRVQLLADADNAAALKFYKHLEWQPTRLFTWKKIVN